MGLVIFHEDECERYAEGVKESLSKTFGLRTLSYKKNLVETAFNKARKQYDAERLLEHIKGENLALWIVSKDIYCGGMNFVFGLASPRIGAVLSAYRLDDVEIVEKEAIHEIGHVLGLRHCNNDCVMQFSNSVWEAKRKPKELCEDCRGKLSL